MLSDHIVLSDNTLSNNMMLPDNVVLSEAKPF
jgi:hypothetical protein